MGALTDVNKVGEPALSKRRAQGIRIGELGMKRRQPDLAVWEPRPPPVTIPLDHRGNEIPEILPLRRQQHPPGQGAPTHRPDFTPTRPEALGQRP